MMSEKDYEALEEAVMATAQGRWFLAEYARRIRAAETDRLLLAFANLADRIDAGGAQQQNPAATPAEPAPPAKPQDPFAIALADIDALPLTERLKLTG